MMQTCLQEHGINFTDVDTLMLPRGPGSFTGIRIGFSVMHGLSIAHGYRIIAPTVFDIWANAYCDKQILILLDNKQGRFYAAEASQGKVNCQTTKIMSHTEVAAAAYKYDLVLANKEVVGATVPTFAMASQLLSMTFIQATDSIQPYYLHDPVFKKL